jgi:hypothetical protein
MAMAHSFSPSRRLPVLVSLLAAIFGTACTGYVQGDDAAPTSAPPVGASSGTNPNSNNSSIGDIQALGCKPEARGTSELGVRRLTKPELVSSLTALFGGGIMGRPSVTVSLTQVPEQTSVNSAEFDNAIIDVEGLEALASTLVDEVFTDQAGAGSLLGCELGDLAQCTEGLVGSFATRAFRRPATQATQQSVRDLVTAIGGLDGLKNGLIRVLISPYFHQHLELGENADDCPGGCAPLPPSTPRLKLSSYEVAERLAFQLTGAPPDDALGAAARAGTLTNLAQVTEHARRLLASQAARQNWERIATEWLGLNHVPDPDPVVAKALGVESVGFGAKALEEFKGFVSNQVFDQGSDLQGLFLGGVLLRPATLLSGTSLTSPILRGVFIKRKVLCAHLAEPDPNAVEAQLESANLSHIELSNRDFFTQLTSPAACSACHAQFNSLGFALEGFGPLGEARTIEVIYDQNGPTGVSHPINTAVDDLHIGARAVPAADATEAVAAIAQSPDARACFQAALIENSRYRALDATDNCTMAELDALQAAGKPLSEALLQTVVNDGIFWKSAEGLQ